MRVPRICSPLDSVNVLVVTQDSAQRSYLGVVRFLRSEQPTRFIRMNLAISSSNSRNAGPIP
eukprot:1522308-Prorocentrum_lima.AAC.1